jgi:Centromere-associated protein K
LKRLRECVLLRCGVSNLNLMVLLYFSGDAMDTVSCQQQDESWDDVFRTFQTELDLLVSSHSDNNSITTVDLPQPIHPVARKCNDLVVAIQENLLRNKIGQPCNDGYDENNSKAAQEILDAEIFLSYHGLKSFNTVLKERIHMEQEKMKSLQDALNEHLEIHRELVQLAQLEKPKESKRTTSEEEVDANEKQFLHVVQENTRLREDLVYITDCIEKRRGNDNMVDQQLHQKTLYDCLQQLVMQRLDQPDDPYIDLSMVPTAMHPQDLHLLREAFIIESHQDNPNRIALLDYTPNITK